ncbi:adenylate kinase [bacterium I07]|nr:adenylate kinase [bacterium I07]
MGQNRSGRIVMLGAPGVGKGTQAKRLHVEFDWVHISTGDMLREAVSRGTELGKQAQAFMEKGDLVPDDVIVGLVAERLNGQDCKEGFILDGFPRTVYQAEQLDRVLDDLNMPLDSVISVEVPDEEIIDRLSRRWVCEKCGQMVSCSENEASSGCSQCGGNLIRRKDDQPETIKYRLQVYQERTQALIGYYEKKGLLLKVDGTGSMDDVYDKVRIAVKDNQA